MTRQCPFCESYDTFLIDKKFMGGKTQEYCVCQNCHKFFIINGSENINYNRHFKEAYLKKKIPELQEHDNFKNEDVITKSDIKDLQIIWYLLKHGKSLEDLIND